jgi:hypothetical protein
MERQARKMERQAIYFSEIETSKERKLEILKRDVFVLLVIIDSASAFAFGVTQRLRRYGTII